MSWNPAAERLFGYTATEANRQIHADRHPAGASSRPVNTKELLERWPISLKNAPSV